MKHVLVLAACCGLLGCSFESDEVRQARKDLAEAQAKCDRENAGVEMANRRVMQQYERGDISANELLKSTDTTHIKNGAEVLRLTIRLAQLRGGEAASEPTAADLTESICGITTEIDKAVNAQMPAGWKIVEPVKCDQGDTSTSSDTAKATIAFTYSFPITINGQRRDNLSRHEGRFSHRDGQWQLEQVAVSFKFFDTEAYSPPVDLLAESVDQTPEFQSLKTMWVNATREALAARAEGDAKDGRAAGGRGRGKPDPAESAEGLHEFAEKFVSELNETSAFPDVYNIGHIKDVAVYRSKKASFRLSQLGKTRKVGFSTAEILLDTANTMQNRSWVRCKLKRSFKIEDVDTASRTIRIAVAYSVESIVEMWPSEEDHKAMAEFRKAISTATMISIGTVKAVRRGDDWQAEQTSGEWHEAFFASPKHRWDHMVWGHKPNIVKYLAR
jgi:hypothetical protein